MSWRAVNDEAPYRKVSQQSEGLEGFLRGDTVKVEASQDPGAKKGGLDRTVTLPNTKRAIIMSTSVNRVRNTCSLHPNIVSWIDNESSHGYSETVDPIKIHNNDELYQWTMQHITVTNKNLLYVSIVASQRAQSHSCHLIFRYFRTWRQIWQFETHLRSHGDSNAQWLRESRRNEAFLYTGKRGEGQPNPSSAQQSQRPQVRGQGIKRWETHLTPLAL